MLLTNDTFRYLVLVNMSYSYVEMYTEDYVHCIIKT